MRTTQFSYHLPKSFIAQSPHSPRDAARLLVLDKKKKTLLHKRFTDLPKLLKTTDVLVFNNSKVFKARLVGKKETGGSVEVFLIKKIQATEWEVLVRGKKLHIKSTICFARNLKCVITKDGDGPLRTVRFNQSGKKFERTVDIIGYVPLPPYIKKRATLAQYQTAYAKHRGSVAAPTAGLHFAPRLLKKIKAAGIQTAEVTLHVGLGTFQPISACTVEDHVIHHEYVHIDAHTAEKLNRAKKEGRRIIAVGTTTVRTLESFSNKKGTLKSGSKETNLYIYPPYEFRFVDALITNFHLPQSSLLVMVAAFAGKSNILNAYDTAVKKNYRFYSFGDGMFIQ